jgi:4-amino-4-deoxy-L-arabinose transferase-like glycosyltransferase
MSQPLGPAASTFLEALRTMGRVYSLERRHPQQEKALVATGLALLVAVHALVLLHTAWRKSPTVDEVAHLPAGLSYWQKGTFAVYHHNPPLVKLLAALPALAVGAEADYSQSWARSFQRNLPISQWNFGWDFMYANASRYRMIYFLARVPVILLSCLGLVLVALWTRSLLGPRAAWVAGSLWATCPNILGHGCLITTDVPAATMGVAAAWCFFHWLQKPGPFRTLLLGTALGLAQLTKFTLLLFYPLWPVWWALGRSLQRLPDFRRDVAVRIAPMSPRNLAWFAAAYAISLVVINAGYFFEGTGKRLRDYRFLCSVLTKPRAEPAPPGEVPAGHPWATVLQQRVNRFRDTWLGLLPVPLPEHYLLGFDEQKLESEGIVGPDGRRHGYYVYLFGELRDFGWWHYYLVALTVKWPVGTLALFTIAVAFACGGRSLMNRLAAAFLWTHFLAFLGVMIIATDINLGVRYVIPSFPYIFVLLGSIQCWKKWGTLVIGMALLWNAASVYRLHPHYLAYFNEFAGGPTKGHAILIDSNIDWGQDLFELAHWVNRFRPGVPVHLAYFGNVDPRILSSLNLGFPFVLAPPKHPCDLSLVHVSPGSSLRQLFLEWSHQRSEQIDRWVRQHPRESPLDMPELKQAALRHLNVPQPGAPGLYAVSVNFLRGLPFRIRDQEGNLWDFSRLADGKRGDPYSYFLRWEPVARIGYSIYIYELPEQTKH